MANTFNNVNDAAAIIAKMAATQFKDHLQFLNRVQKADAGDFDGKNGYKAGATVQISIPPRYIPQDTFDITSSKQDSVEEKTPLVLDIQKTIGLSADSFEFATEIELTEYYNREVKPAIDSIAEYVELDMLAKATQSVANTVGTAGSTTFSVADILAARTKMQQYLAPRGERFLLMDASSGAAAVDARKGLFQSSEEISKQYKMGYIGMSDGFTWLENELVHQHTNGNDVTGVAADGTVTEGDATLHVDGLTTTTGTVTKGSVFTIAGVNAVHPITKKVYPFLQQFVVTANVTADGGGDADLAISPKMYAESEGLQNISALPANDAALVFVGAANGLYTQNLAYDKSAFRCVSVPLIMPTNAEFAAQATEEGITISIVRDWDINKREMITRLDFLGGIATVRPEHAVRITS